ncbi:MAG: FHA domain-containing protein [Gammaproteobacteria bacterium]|nr:FHA domain-containing protein [Gammaproteobacteria bacterium]
MRHLAIELNDAGIVVADEAAVLSSEPGFALAERREIVTGHQAYAQSRLKPRDTSHKHWSELSIEPGSASIAGVKTSAELAYAQLEQLWRRIRNAADDEVGDTIVTVPSPFGGQSLGVLLGLAQEAGIPVGALVDQAAAASVRPYPGRQLLYVDAELHRVYVTPLAQGDRVAAEEPVTLETTGLYNVMDQFARRVAELFVLGTRFDPFHRAQTEQALYDGMPGLLTTLEDHDRAEISIPYEDDVFSIDVERSALLGAAQGFYRAILQLIAQCRRDKSGLVVQLSDRLTMLPGLKDALGRLDNATIVALEPGAAAQAVLAARDQLVGSGGGVKLYRHLPWRDDPADAPEPAAAAPAGAPAAVDDEPRPTHVVYRGIAYPVNGEGVLIGRSKLDQRRAIVIEASTEGVSRAHCELAVIDGELRLRDLSSFGTFVNERRIEGEETLKPADVIRVGSPGAELTVVRVEDADGA